MSRTIVTLEIDSDLEPLLRDYATFLDEMKHLAKSAPDGTVLATCERAVVGHPYGRPEGLLVRRLRLHPARQ